MENKLYPNPLVSVITVVFNAELYLEETILSVINQSYTDIQYIVIDGGSKDSTLDIIDKYRESIDIVISEKDNGMYDALVKGLKLIKGDICCYINGDDFLSKTCIASVVDCFLSNPNISWLTGINVNYNSKSELYDFFQPFIYRSSFIKKGIYGKKLPFIQQESTFWRTDLNKCLDMSKLSSFRYAGDLYIWYNFAQHTELYILKRYLGGFRIHTDQLSANLDEYFNEVNSFCDKIKIGDYIMILFDKIINNLSSFRIKSYFSRGRIKS